MFCTVPGKETAPAALAPTSPVEAQLRESRRERFVVLDENERLKALLNSARERATGPYMPNRQLISPVIHMCVHIFATPHRLDPDVLADTKESR